VYSLLNTKLRSAQAIGVFLFTHYSHTTTMNSLSDSLPTTVQRGAEAPTAVAELGYAVSISPDGTRRGDPTPLDEAGRASADRMQQAGLTVAQLPTRTAALGFLRLLDGPQGASCHYTPVEAPLPRVAPQPQTQAEADALVARLDELIARQRALAVAALEARRLRDEAELAYEAGGR